MMKSESIDLLATAMCAFQAAVTNPERSKTVEVTGTTKAGKNFRYDFKYAPLDAIIDHIRKPLADAGLSFSQGFEVTDSRTLLTTTILHQSGQWMKSAIPLPNLGNEAKDLGAAITYTKRYSLSAALGLAPEEDDDNRIADKQVAGYSPSTDDTKKPNHGSFHGPLGVTELKNHMRAIAGDLVRITSADELDGFLNDNQEVLAQCQRDLPEWYFGKGDNLGAKAAIDAKRSELLANEPDMRG